MSTTPRSIERLARLLGVLPVWRDQAGQVRRVDEESLAAVLAALGAGAERPEEAWRAALEEREARLVEPFEVAWDGGPPAIRLRPPEGARTVEVALCAWDPEHGRGAPVGAWSADARELPHRRGRRPLGAAVAWTLPRRLEPGWYELEVACGGRAARGILVAAPSRLAALPLGVGLFAPMHGLHDARTQRIGGFRELGRLAAWAGGLGLDHVACLPITAGDELEASPYSPLSRRFWNERYVDLAALPELEACAEARRIAESDAVREDLALLREQNGALVHPAVASRLARRVLEPCAAAVSGGRAEALRAFVRERPEVELYASWRAAREQGGTADAREGADDLARARDGAAATHVYAQWVCELELESLRRRAAERGVGLLLDVPLGARGDGFDVATSPGSFVAGASAGAPPDVFFDRGQTWGFPPPHPHGARVEGHRDLALAVRRHARFAGALRLDHVMAFLRLWVVPSGREPSQGAYVRYPMDELLAVICLEASRAGAAVVGEDLGTVPESVHDAMDAHGLHRTVVLPFEFRPEDPDRALLLERLPERAVLSLNTHDLPPFAAFWSEHDLDEHASRRELGAPAIRAQRRERRRFRDAWRAELVRRDLVPARAAAGRDAEIQAVLQGSLAALAGAPPRHLQVALDDLCGERRRQNAPGTARRENWRLRARRSLEELERGEEPARTLRDLVRRRRAAAAPLPPPGAAIGNPTASARPDA